MIVNMLLLLIVVVGSVVIFYWLLSFLLVVSNELFNRVRVGISTKYPRSERFDNFVWGFRHPWAVAFDRLPWRLRRWLPAPEVYR